MGKSQKTTLVNVSDEGFEVKTIIGRLKGFLSGNRKKSTPGIFEAIFSRLH